LKLLKEINNEAKKVNRTIDCLLQLYIAKEETKFGLSEKEMFELLDNIKLLQFKNVRIVGLMGMATFVDKQDQIRKEFEQLAKTFHEIKAKYFAESDYFTEMSMGMSGDYKIAIECGSTMIRIGHDIFGEEE
jgi:pyridoxal phosphate enzyme (YggS family)